MSRQAVILAGGFGTRLAHIVTDVPKPMALIKNKPFLDYQIELLRSNGFDDFIILTGYKSEIIENYYAKQSDIHCIKETTPLGTGGAVFNAFSHLEDEFFIINGDTFFDIDFSILQEFSCNKPSVIALRYSTDISRYGIVDTDDKFVIKKFTEKGNLPDNYIDGYISGGIYYFKKSLLKEICTHFEQTNISMENDIFPLLVKEKTLYGLPVGGAFIDIGIPEDYYTAQAYIPQTLQQIKKPALFIDKDGTLIVNTNYPHGKDIKIISSTLDLLNAYKNKGFQIIIVTNQAGIAKNKFSFQDMQENFDAITAFYHKNGIDFCDIEYCPYHIDAVLPKYKYFSKARKPEAGMILHACEKHRLDLRNSVMIGDNQAVDKIKLPYLKSVIIGDKNV
ncbi:MAG: HAD-IIIA family hydrolase [Alphaproteobacteria bacterium]|nr:HAD-IIIA family hydrolase [Alphaproteobacteria bacterium]